MPLGRTGSLCERRTCCGAGKGTVASAIRFLAKQKFCAGDFTNANPKTRDQEIGSQNRLDKTSAKQSFLIAPEIGSKVGHGSTPAITSSTRSGQKRMTLRADFM